MLFRGVRPPSYIDYNRLDKKGNNKYAKVRKYKGVFRKYISLILSL